MRQARPFGVVGPRGLVAWCRGAIEIPLEARRAGRPAAHRPALAEPAACWPRSRAGRHAGGVESRPLCEMMRRYLAGMLGGRRTTAEADRREVSVVTASTQRGVDDRSETSSGRWRYRADHRC